MSNDIRQMLSEVKSQTSDFLSDLVRIPSLSGQESKVAERICMEMRSVHFDEAGIDRFGNVIGRIGNGRNHIAMDAHIDTVDVGNRDLWEFEPFSGHIENGFVWGRGASDQKGGMASLVYGGYLIKKYNLLPGDMTLWITGTVSEEDCDGLCWKYLIEKENLKPDMVLITEPTDCRLYRGQRGRMEITARTTGISSHGSAPERGVNAVYLMADIIQGIAALNNRLASDEFLGKGSVTISEITSTAPSLCSVADSCRIYLDRRLTWGETPQKALQEIKALDPSGKLDVVVPVYNVPTHTGMVYPMVKEFPAWKTPVDHPAVLSGVETHRIITGKDPEVGRWTFSTNAVSISGVHRIPCIGFGPGKEEWAHAPNERCPVDQLSLAAVFYALYPRQFNRFSRNSG